MIAGKNTKRGRGWGISYMLKIQNRIHTWIRFCTLVLYFYRVTKMSVASTTPVSAFFARGADTTTCPVVDACT